MCELFFDLISGLSPMKRETNSMVKMGGFAILDLSGISTALERLSGASTARIE
jgi:hypothetical protein